IRVSFAIGLNGVRDFPWLPTRSKNGWLACRNDSSGCLIPIRNHRELATRLPCDRWQCPNANHGERLLFVPSPDSLFTQSGLRAGENPLEAFYDESRIAHSRRDRRWCALGIRLGCVGRAVQLSCSSRSVGLLWHDGGDASTRGSLPALGTG